MPSNTRMVLFGMGCLGGISYLVDASPVGEQLGNTLKATLPNRQPLSWSITDPLSLQNGQETEYMSSDYDEFNDQSSGGDGDNLEMSWESSYFPDGADQTLDSLNPMRDPMNTVAHSPYHPGQVSEATFNDEMDFLELDSIVYPEGQKGSYPERMLMRKNVNDKDPGETGSLTYSLLASQVSEIEAIFSKLQVNPNEKPVNFFSKCPTLSELFQNQLVDPSTDDYEGQRYQELESYFKSVKKSPPKTRMVAGKWETRLNDIFQQLVKAQLFRHLLVGYEWDFSTKTITMRTFTTDEGHQCTSLEKEVGSNRNRLDLRAIPVIESVQDTIEVLKAQCTGFWEKHIMYSCVFQEAAQPSSI
ncbi:hypothetical protein BJ085DRAFT_29642 [Dimargaris cristalligena]|uniref:Uncharacterized protein n=1 Tax=Dimargaris cristalligena TaxID=215637 RepID=A0A4P9ZYX7_9FUNG|nr:hypothetical protein BJ085DRAFT_29642 [Dimargaris cristalligena]|eukprot:RKP38956.1 hypothetical protein BJ085DRAFT_29642 [Dimargaris cristalligena]